MTAPERIWATWKEDFGAVQIGTWADSVRIEYLGTEYHRADLTEARIARAVKAALVGAAIDCEVWAGDLDHHGYPTSAMIARDDAKRIRALATDEAFMARVMKEAGNG